MKFQRVFTTIDTHTGGNPTRTVISGIPKLKGSTMADKMLDMKENYDWIRRFLMYEPRGHGVMSGALITEPSHPDADIGVIYIETGGYLPMCGHDTIGCCTALVESGLIDVKEPYTNITLDTPAGIVDVKIKVTNGKAEEVSFLNVPSFLLKTIQINVDGIGKIDCDIAYGGNFYAIVDARKINLPLTTENAQTIVDKAILIRNAINKAEDIVHPVFPFIRGCTHVEFYTDPVHKNAHLKNTVVVPPGGIDRSPCGTGTSAKVAVMFEKGELNLRNEFVHESIVGSVFRAKAIETTNVGHLQAVVVEITGSAWVMGMHRFFYQEDDPLRTGFLLIPPMEENQ